MDIRELGEADLDEVGVLAAKHPFWPNRGYASYGYDLAAQDAERALDDIRAVLTGSAEGIVLAAVDGERLAGVVHAGPQAYDTEHFGMPMQVVHTLLTATNGSGRSPLASALCRAVLDHYPGMTTARVDAGDVHALDGVQDAGYRVYNNVMTYVSDRTNRMPEPEGLALEHRVFDREHPIDLDPETKEALAVEASGLFPASRFHGDPRIPADRAHAFYERWVRQILDGGWADWMFMTFEDGQPVVFLAFRYQPGCGPGAEPSILGEAFGFVSRSRGTGGATASYPALLRAFPTTFLEYPTQVRITELLKMLPHASTFLRSTYVLHGWSERDV